ncbi:MAG: ADP-ribosylglycohydrolase family protein [Clostridia bacterium]|nr:ADP-ribosylglycohydrolase family protein [Clostridia bacterium]
MKMKLNYDVYKDKVRAAWIGKNIGGTMGGPYEGKREVLNISGFATAPGEVLPNDDLDLQLVWLHAMESIGPQNVNCNTLGEFWISYIPPHWNEYGIGKCNMKLGLIPPLSGDFRNSWKHSNGAWIRTEIWATLAPACPEIAAKYAIEDAVVDHGCGEGTVAAAFVAAMQSAAFAESDIRKCLDVAFSAVPEESRLSKSIRKVLECYDNGVSWLDARNTVQQMNADIGDGWFEAPSNVAYAVIGLIYGEGDFKKSMITAINCADDTDCTAATVGATLGILNGTAGIPKDWADYIGDEIVTISVATGVLRTTPRTCSELTDRVVRLAPQVLFVNDAKVTLTDGESELGDDLTFGEGSFIRKKLCEMRPYSFRIDGTVFYATVIWDESPEIAPGGEIGVTVRFENKVRRNLMVAGSSSTSPYGNSPYFLSFRWMLPDGFSVEGARGVNLSHKNPHNPGVAEVHFTVRAEQGVSSVNRLVLEVVNEGRCLPTYIPLVLIG